MRDWMPAGGLGVALAALGAGALHGILWAWLLPLLVLPLLMLFHLASVLYSFLKNRIRKIRAFSAVRTEPARKALNHLLQEPKNTQSLALPLPALHALRGTDAVPALLYALEETIDQQPPGWRERAEALVKALGQLGDQRALPLLYQLSHVRGIGIIGAVRQAVHAIEPRSSLLRPNCPAYQTHLLLHYPEPGAEENRALLRSVQSDQA